MSLPVRTDVYLAALDHAGHAERERALLPQLAPAEQARYRSFSAETRRRTWLAGRELLLAGLAHRQGATDPALLRTEAHGGVGYGRDDLRLNLSHSGEWLAVAVAGLPVGIDIERLRPRAVTTQAARVFSAAEAAQLAGESDPLPRFYRLWTLKEAACKAAGLTIWDALHQVCFDLEAGRCQLATGFPAGAWHFVYGSVAPDWSLALALRGAVPQAGFWRRGAAGWTPLELTGLGRVAGSGSPALS